MHVGTLKRVDVQRRVVTIEHQTVAGANMPPMTMEFRLDAGASTGGLAESQHIAFMFTPSREGMSISEVQPVRMAGTSIATSAPNTRKSGMSGTDMGAMDKEMMAKCHETMKRK